MGFYEDLEKGKGGEEFMQRTLRKTFGDFEVVPKDTNLPFDLFNDRYKIEVKTDFMSKETGNVAIEYYCNGKPSGISTTKADFWAHIFWCTRQWYYIMPTVRELKSYIKNNDFKRVKGGDNNSQMILIPSTKLKESFRTITHSIGSGL